MRNKDAPLILNASAALDEALRAFKGGGVIAYPTETFYGLCVDPFNKEAVEKLFTLKGRSPKSPISVIISDVSMLNEIAAGVTPSADALMKRFWPGPLTIIFKASSKVPPELLGSTGKIGVRVSGSPVARRLSETLSSPITATSANPTGKSPPNSPEEVIGYFNGTIDILIDGGRLPGRSGSTVVDASGEGIRIVREGEVPTEDILKAL